PVAAYASDTSMHCDGSPARRPSKSDFPSGTSVPPEASAALASPKNRGPDQPAPVIFRAMLVSDRWSFPSNSKPSSVTTTAWVRPCHSRTRRAPGLIRGCAGGAIRPSLSNPAARLAKRRNVAFARPPKAISCSQAPSHGNVGLFRTLGNYASSVQQRDSNRDALGDAFVNLRAFPIEKQQLRLEFPPPTG